MAVTHDWREGVLVVTASGSYAQEEVLSAIRSAARTRGVEAPLAVMIDVTQSESILTRPSRSLNQAAQEVSAMGSLIGKMAVVAGSTARFGLLRMADVYASQGGLTSAVFRSREDAMRWLREPPATPERPPHHHD